MPKVIPQGPEGTIWFGGHPDEALVCLRVCGDDLDPDEVSRALGCQPWLLDHPVSEEATVAEAIHAHDIKALSAAGVSGL